MSKNCDSFTLPAGADLTTKEFCLGKTSLVGGAMTVIPCAVLGERADCVIGGPGIAGVAIDCFPDRGRIVPMKVGAVAVAVNDELTTDALGLAKTAVSTNIVRAKAMDVGAPGAVIRTLWVDAYAKP